MNNIEIFRDNLDDVVQVLQEWIETAPRGRGTRQTLTNCLRLLEAIRDDYNRLFPRSTYNTDAQRIDALIKRFCHSEVDKCPLCGSKMKKRDGKYGPFYGCTKYPGCGGVRREDGEVGFNQALREFITEKVKMHGETEPERPDRFANLEL